MIAISTTGLLWRLVIITVFRCLFSRGHQRVEASTHGRPAALARHLVVLPVASVVPPAIPTLATLTVSCEQLVVIIMVAPRVSMASIPALLSRLRLSPATIATTTSVLVVIVDELALQMAAASTWALSLNLVPSMLVKAALALIDLVFHELVDPEAHLDVVLQHRDDHVVEREAQIVLLNRKVLELSVQHPQLSIALLDDLKRAHTRVVLSRHRREAGAPNVLKVTEQRLYHLLNIVRALVHVLLSQESSTLQHNRLIHFLVLLELFELLFNLVQLEIEVVGLLLAQRQLLVDVGLERVVGRLDLMLGLLVARMVSICILLNRLFHELLFFLLDFFELRVECLNGLLKIHLALLKLLQSLFGLLTLSLRSFDKHIDILHDVIFGCVCLDHQTLLGRDQVLLVQLLLKLANLGLQLRVLALNLDQIHLDLTGLALHDAGG